MIRESWSLPHSRHALDARYLFTVWRHMSCLQSFEFVPFILSCIFHSFSVVFDVSLARVSVYVSVLIFLSSISYEVCHRSTVNTHRTTSKLVLISSICTSWRDDTNVINPMDAYVFFCPLYNCSIIGTCSSISTGLIIICSFTFVGNMSIRNDILHKYGIFTFVFWTFIFLWLMILFYFGNFLTNRCNYFFFVFFYDWNFQDTYIFNIILQ